MKSKHQAATALPASHIPVAVAAWFVAVLLAAAVITLGVSTRYVLPSVLLFIPAATFLMASSKTQRPAVFAPTRIVGTDHLSEKHATDYQSVREIDQWLADAKEGDNLWLAGVAVVEFLTPHARFYHPLVTAIRSGLSVRVILLDIHSDAAKRIAHVQEADRDTPPFGSEAWQTWYSMTRFFDELKTATDAAKIHERHFDGVQIGATGTRIGHFEARLLDDVPVQFVAIYNQRVTLMRPLRYREGETPLLRVGDVRSSPEQETALLQLFTLHFHSMWQSAVRLTSRDSGSATATRRT